MMRGDVAPPALKDIRGERKGELQTSSFFFFSFFLHVHRTNPCDEEGWGKERGGKEKQITNITMATKNLPFRAKIQISRLITYKNSQAKLWPKKPLRNLCRNSPKQRAG